MCVCVCVYVWEQYLSVCSSEVKKRSLVSEMDNEDNACYWQLGKKKKKKTMDNDEKEARQISTEGIKIL